MRLLEAGEIRRISDRHPIAGSAQREFYRVVSKWQYLKDLAVSFGFEIIE